MRLRLSSWPFASLLLVACGSSTPPVASCPTTPPPNGSAAACSPAPKATGDAPAPASSATAPARPRAWLVAAPRTKDLDGTGAAGKDDQTIVIADGRIRAIGDAAKAPAPAGARVPGSWSRWRRCGRTASASTRRSSSTR